MRRTTFLTVPAILALGAIVACEPTPPTGATPDSVTAPPSAQGSTQPSASTQPASPDIVPVSPIAVAGPAETAVKASNGFGLALYQELKGNSGNLVFSPASISVALAMTYAGAKGTTAKEMETTLQSGPDAKALHAAWATQLSAWQGHKDAEIAVANRLFGDKKYSFEAPYLSLTKAHYGAPLQPVDFAGAPEKQRVMINGWVAEQTRDRIQDLIPPPGVTNDTRMALVNAIYFKAKWNEPFPASRTKDDSFTTADGTKVTTPMMSHTTYAQYGEVDGVQLMELGYKGGRFATLFVLPPATQKLAAVESKLDRALLDKWTGALKGERTWIRLPKVKIEPGAAVELKKSLQAMGMKQAFVSGAADFTGITNPTNPEDRLFIEEVYHKAFVAMDEAGTEAAAATAVMMGRAGGVAAEPKKFHAERPFLFFIRDTTTHLVMFAGRIVDPTR
ncbi:MAG: serpin family protein [Deltaproteobacteria bacterium]|nr:serpin family protein [Deltaproteobacteria bacterium]